jgi:hypothetical protein
MDACVGDVDSDVATDAPDYNVSSRNVKQLSVDS